MAFNLDVVPQKFVCVKTVLCRRDMYGKRTDLRCKKIYRAVIESAERNEPVGVPEIAVENCNISSRGIYGKISHFRIAGSWCFTRIQPLIVRKIRYLFRIIVIGKFQR